MATKHDTSGTAAYKTVRITHDTTCGSADNLSTSSSLHNNVIKTIRKI